MKEGPDIARIGSMIGDPARANMLTALMAGKALTATELANEAGITRQTASSHLKHLAQGHLVATRKQGRHRYFTLASDRVAQSLEMLMNLAQHSGHMRTRTGPRDIRLREARVCYNHLAGHMGIRLYDHMVSNGHLSISPHGLSLTDEGEAFIRTLGIKPETLGKRERLCRECLDWSERRSHLAGSLGRAILQFILESGWAKRETGSRAIVFSSTGRSRFDSLLGGRSPSPEE